MLKDDHKDIDAYLARIRKTIADSERLVSQAELRIAETDRMLESQGLTREQVMAMRFSEAQIEAANAELKRRGLDPLEKWGGLQEREEEQLRAEEPASGDGADNKSGGDDLAYRQRKFGMMMKPFQI